MITHWLHACAWLSLAALLAGCGVPAAGLPPSRVEPPPEPVTPRPGTGLSTAPAEPGSGSSPSTAPPTARVPRPDLPMQPGSSPRRVASQSRTERARQLLRSGQYGLALMELERSLSLDGSNPYAHYYIAVSHYRLRNFKASLDFLEVAEAVLGYNRPWLVQTLVLRGDNLRALGRFKPARAAYRRALSLDPTNPSAHRGLLWARQRSKALSW
ncbi:MAG: tetratricopeptide repeat protein [Deltaproteobacteria bacterium]|nr:tetratricopeptide repeat protein [Deltaproteobacteria bacterium]